MRPGCKPVGFAALLLLGVASPAWADLQSNPGGPTIDTSSTSANITYVATDIENRIDDYSTTLNVLLNGVSLSSQTYAAAFGDADVQSAIGAADTLLTDDGATYGLPQLLSTATLLQNSVVTSTMVAYTCQTVPMADFNGNSTPTTTITFGPATIPVGHCDEDTFDVNPGQTDINIDAGLDFIVPYDLTTTDTYLTSTIYEIDGVSAAVAPPPVSMPEPGTLALFGAGVAGLAGMRRRGANDKSRTSAGGRFKPPPAGQPTGAKIV